MDSAGMSIKGGGQVVEEDAFQVDFPFDGQTIRADATFVEGDETLVGTHLLRCHRLTIDFPARTMTLVHLPTSVA
jgi:hypothetical protein